MNGAVPMKMIRISFGWTSSVRGNQLAALFSQGWGEMPSKSRPSFHRPSGTPPVRAFWMSPSLEGSWTGGAWRAVTAEAKDRRQAGISSVFVLMDGVGRGRTRRSGIVAPQSRSRRG